MIEDSKNIKPLPNSVLVFILGICSLIFSCLFVGFVTGILGVIFGDKSLKIYRENPSEFSNFGLLNAGYIMSIIGLVLSSITVLYFVFFVGTISAFWSNALWFM